MHYPIAVSRLLLCLMLLAGFLAPEDTSAQIQVRDQTRCIEKLNRNLRNVARKQSDEARNCVRDFSRDELEQPTFADCLLADPRERVAKAIQKTVAHEAKYCVATPPDFGIADPQTINEAGVVAGNAILFGLFGPDPDQVLAKKNVDLDTQRCQERVLKRTSKCIERKFGEFRDCKYDGLRDESIQSALDMENCFEAINEDTFVSLFCDRSPFHPDFLRREVTNCQKMDVDFDTAIPGCDGAADDHACLLRHVDCALCEALNAADGLAMNCDALDDGQQNGSCDFEAPGSRTCELVATPDLDPSLLTLETSGIDLLFSAASGAIDVTCGAIDSATHQATCSCDVAEHLVFEGFGYLCLNPHSGCDAGTLDCDTGALSCNLGITAQLEFDLPCGDEEPTEIFSTTGCLPLSTSGVSCEDFGLEVFSGLEWTGSLAGEPPLFETMHVDLECR